MTGFVVGVSRDFRGADGANVWGDIGLDRLADEGVGWRWLDDDVDVLRPADLAGLDAVIFARPAVDAGTFAGPGPHPRLFARFGVGYDAVDLDACTAHDALVTITPDGARRAVATATLTLLLAARAHLVVKDGLVRAGTWGERTAWMGRGLTGRTVGFVGMGNTASDLVALLAPFGCRVIAADPGLSVARAGGLGVEPVDLDEVFRSSDVVVVMAALTPATHHLVDARRLALLPEGATLVNVARGPIVDEAALVAGLAAGRPATAGLDVFETEPLPVDSPLVASPAVVLAPHCLAWTDEMAAGNGASAVQAVLDVAAGRTPRFVVNRAVLQRPGLAHLVPA